MVQFSSSKLKCNFETLLKFFYSEYGRCVLFQIKSQVSELSLNSFKNKFVNQTDLSCNFEKANFNSLYVNICRVDWSILKRAECVDEACDMFESILSSLYDSYVAKTRRKPSKYHPWLNGNIIKDLESWKNISRRKYDTTKEETIWNQYKIIRAKV